MRSMDSILADEPSVHTLPDGPESESPPAEKPAPVEEPKGETPEEPKAAKPPTSSVRVAEDDDADDDGDVDQSLEGLKKALTAVRGDKRTMRKKWREAEKRAEDTARRIAQLEGQLNARQPTEQPAKVEAPKPPDFFGSPEEHLSFREKQLQEQFEAKQHALREQLREEQFRRDAKRSERRVRLERQDYEDAKRAVLQAYPADSQFWNQLLDDPEPAEAVYAEGKKILRGGVSEREAQLQAELEELRAKVGQSASVAPAAPARPIPPKSIAGARGTGHGIKQEWTGPRPAKSIYD